MVNEFRLGDVVVTTDDIHAEGPDPVKHPELVDQAAMAAIIESAVAIGVISDPETFLPRERPAIRALEATKLMFRAIHPDKEQLRMASFGQMLLNTIDAADRADLDESVPEGQRLDKLLGVYVWRIEQLKRTEQALEKLAGDSPVTALQLAEENAVLKRTVQHWKANHDHQVDKARVFLERQDLPLERVNAYRKMQIMEQQALLGKLTLTRIAQWSSHPAELNDVPQRQRAFYQTMAKTAVATMAVTDTPLMLEMQRLEEWIDKLHNGMEINCMFCGTTLGRRDEEVDETRREAIKRHGMYCPKHPLAALRKAFQQFVLEIECFDNKHNSALIAAAKKLLGVDDDRTPTTP